jgi:DNA-binding NarL/FixJ family response regulator
MLKTIRLFLVDDEHYVRQGLRMRLSMEPDIIVVGEAEDGGSALERVAELRPDVVLMDVNLPGLDGISATARLREAAPECAVVMLSLHDDSGTKERAARAGACGFVGKQDLDGALTQAIRAAAAGADGPERGAD